MPQLVPKGQQNTSLSAGALSSWNCCPLCVFPAGEAGAAGRARSGAAGAAACGRRWDGAGRDGAGGGAGRTAGNGDRDPGPGDGHRAWRSFQVCGGALAVSDRPLSAGAASGSVACQRQPDRAVL